MPSLDADNRYLSNQHNQISSPSVYDSADTQPNHQADLTDSIPSLPNYSYTIPESRRPSINTKIASSTANTINSAQRDDNSPDPHDFYRAHQERYGREEMMSGPGQGTIRVERRDGEAQGSARSRPKSPQIRNGNGPRLQPISSRINNAQYSSSNHDRSPLSATKSSPTLSSTSRNRQTSLKELVNKFNQTPDEVPPLPKKTGSRSPSANSNSGGYIAGSRTASQSKGATQGISSGSFSSDAASNKSSRYQQNRRGRTQDDGPASPKARRNYKMEPTDPMPVRPFASQSMVDLAPEIAALPRRPLFGEVLASAPVQSTAGYGIRGPKRRRGSEGSMHSPNPMFADPTFARHRDPSPVSPNTWYYGTAPPLDEIKAKGDIPDPPPNLHRRTRSDFQGVPSGPPHSRPFTNNLSPPSSPSSINNSRRNSHSRIPIRARRPSASDSGDSAIQKVSSLLDNNTSAKTPTRTRAPPPMPLQNTRSSPRYSRSTTPQKSPRYQPNNGRPSTSPRLAAYISAPMPKKSPPLRSSRPRQPVSSASTSASRARAVDKFANENGSSSNIREQRNRRPPELGAVDFAARRQKIQQAFTKTVKEEEEREIRRASMAHDIHSLESSKTAVEAMDDRRPQPSSSSTASPSSNVHAGDQSRTMEDESKDSERALTIDTGQLTERSVLDLSMEDSPTLGTFNTQFTTQEHRLAASGSTPTSDIDPGSAITAGTSDSVDTFFDDEPQDESRSNSRRPSTDHPDLLTSVATLRSSRTPSPRGAKRRNGVEEPESGDDRESIQIMLGATPVLEKASFHDQYEDKSKDVTSSDGPDSRWSMSSWTSSTKSRDERDAQLERIDEHSPSKPEAPTHLSYSTTASEPTQSAWSPASFTSPKTDRTTMDSDGYSTINRVLDHYHHDPNSFNAEMIHDMQQHIYNQSPDLARQGGYDPRRVMQLYLQRMAKERNTLPSPMPEPIRAQIKERSSSLAIPGPTSEKEVRDDMDEKILPVVGHNRNLSASSAADLDVDDEGNLKPARASLTRPDDFMDMSPSLGGFYERAADTPQDELKPPLPEKDDPFIRSDRSLEMHERAPGDSSYPDDESRPQLPPINFGHGGLAINVEPPQRGDSPSVPPPPLPVHSPPPPPNQQKDQSRQSSLPYSAKPSFRDQNDGAREARPLPTSKLSEVSSASHNIQSVESDGLTKSSSPSADQKRLTRRKHIIKELVDTEHSYGQDMVVVIDIYKETSNVIVITAEDVKTLFGNSAQIVTFSNNFLDALKQASKPIYVLSRSKRFHRRSNGTSHSGNTGDESSINGGELSDEEKDRKTFIGEAFGQHMSGMEKVYTEYLKNHDAANQKLQQLQKNPKVEIWLNQCKEFASDITSAWDLDSLLVKPVQRILKYPLLLDQLLEVTPENHPDYTALDVAAREMKGMSMRINEMKKRADILEQVTYGNRKRKDSDMRIGLAKAFGATKKLRQQTGASGMFDDKAYTAVSERFSEHFVRLQIIMRDVEMYTGDVEIFMRKFLDFAMAMEAHIDVGQTSYPEFESKWRKFRMSMRDMSTTALCDHIEQVRRFVVQPMTTLVKLHEGPQRMMGKREKRLGDYARFKAISDRGDRPDKKTVEQGQQFLALNDSLKDELPKLFALTGKLMGRCLSNFVQLQHKWLGLWKVKLRQAIDLPSATQDGQFQDELIKITKAFTGDFAFYEAQVASLGVCNGALLNDTPNLVQFASPATTTSTLVGDGVASPRAGPSFDSSRLSVSSDKSPVLPQPDFGNARGSGSFYTMADAALPQRQPSHRMRASSSVSGHGPTTPQLPGSWRSYSNNTTPTNATPGRPATATGRTVTDPSPSLRPSMESSRINRLSDDSSFTKPSPGSSYPPTSQPRAPSPSPNRYSGFFSSAMPMTDSPPSESPTNGGPKQDFNIIFLAASVYEFNIDRARKEAGYPYLTYVAGEIFDVIGEKGELWLAKNQDDATNLVGWIWNKHFVKLAG